MKGKIFTPDEANRMLPLVSRIADDIVATYEDVNVAIQAFEAERPKAEADESRLPLLRERDQEVTAALDRLQGLIYEIEALGGTVKDHQLGKIDFYGEVDGEIVYLCWQRGEDAIAYFHELEESSGERHPIPTKVAA
jgi:hypothetical protein